MSKREIRLSVLEMEKLGVTLAFPQYPDTKAEENSRRLAACWNACKGISTENLEDNKPIIELANDYNAVLKQRDMLLARLSESTGILEAWKFGSTTAMQQIEINEVAMASVKGGVVE